MALIERPHIYAFSKNEMRYVFQLESLARPGLVLQVKLLYQKLDAATFFELTTVVLKPAADGKIYFPFQAYIHSLLEYIMPYNLSIVTPANDQACRYYIQFRELDNDNTDVAWTTNESLFVRTAIKGGIERHKASGNNFFVNYLETAKPFLTWLPSGRFIYYNEPLFLSFLNITGGGYLLKFTVVATDGQVANVSFNHGYNTALLNHLFVSPAALNLGAYIGNKPMHYYEVFITNTAGTTVLVSPYRLYIEHGRPAYQFYDLVYANSISGIDAVRITGDTDIIQERSTSDAEAGPNINDRFNSVRAQSKYFDSITLQRNFKGNIGLLKIRTKEQQEAFTEILVSRRIYMKIDNRWIPVLNLQKSQNFGNRKDIIEGFPIEWQLSESNEVFTPAAAIFGEGTVEQVNYLRQFTVINNSANTVTKITLHKNTPEWVEFAVNVAPGGTIVVPYNFSIDASFLYVELNSAPVACTAILIDDSNTVRGENSNVVGIYTYAYITLNYTSITDVFTIQVN